SRRARCSPRPAMARSSSPRAKRFSSSSAPEPTADFTCATAGIALAPTGIPILKCSPSGRNVMSDPQPSVAPIERRVDAVEAVLATHGHRPSEFVVEATKTADERWVPENGARIVARAWTDPAYRARLLANGKAAAAELGFELPRHHRHLVFLEDTPDVHNVICCTLCSCTAFTIIGLPPDWYKDF